MVYFYNMSSLNFGQAIQLVIAVWLLAVDFLGLSLCV